VGIERQWGGSAQGLFVLPIIVPGGYQDQGILEGRIFDGRIIEKVVERLLPQIDYCGNWISDPCNPNGELVQGWFFR
jgi:hypothetical protein